MPDPPTFDYIFGYGSLVSLREPTMIGGVEAKPVPGRLHGYRRLWGAAMDNWGKGAVDKYYVDPVNGEKPHLRVAFLDVEAAGGVEVNGLAIPSDAARLAEFDAREVNYTRIDLTRAFEPSVPGRVYAYIATPAARERLEAGLAAGDVFISREYDRFVHDSFAALGPGELEEYERSTTPPRIPLRELELRPPPG